MEINEPQERNELQDRVDELEGELEEAHAEEARQSVLVEELQEKLDNLTANFVPNTGDEEPPFRASVRDLLDLDWSVRDEKIYEEIRRLKREDNH